ncbi:hypothetical protein D3C80_1263120 [compost metagenome]
MVSDDSPSALNNCSGSWVAPRRVRDVETESKSPNSWMKRVSSFSFSDRGRV